MFNPRLLLTIAAVTCTLITNFSYADVSYKYPEIQWKRDRSNPFDYLNDINGVVTDQEFAKQPVLVHATIHGMIQKGDSKDLVQLLNYVLEKKRSVRLSIDLNTGGGDIDEAMIIGRLIRQAHARVNVKEQCSSACVLILAAGEYKSVTPSATIGIHRPYSIAANITNPKLEKKKYKAIEAKIAKYLDEMNISSNLVTAMMNVPPESVKYLTFDEASQYGLLTNDRYVEEANKMDKALSYGISRAELVKRESLINRTCYVTRDINEQVRCEEQILRTGR